MLRKFLLPIAAAIGALVGLLIVFWSQESVPPAPVLFPPASSPYRYSIYGEGIVEASSRNLAIGTPFSEVVTKVFVVEGTYVHEGDPLFLLDTRLFEAQAETARSQIEAALVSLKNQQVQFSFYDQLTDKRAVSRQAYEQSYYAMREAEEQLKVAEAMLGEVEANLARSLICAPIDGEVLQVNIHVGEVAPNISPINPQTVIPYASTSYPLILLGRTEPLSLRIDIDEEDSWRYQKGAAATAFVRGNSHIHFPLQFVRVEPYIVPKGTFTGETTQRVDTRVLQVFYNFEPGDHPVYTGQLLDVFIEAPAERPVQRPRT